MKSLQFSGQLQQSVALVNALQHPVREQRS
jgi:hypothetical protein